MPLGRPRKQGLDYVPISVQMHADTKVKKLRMLYGTGLAYGFLVITYEFIFESPKPFLFLSPDVEKLLIQEMEINKKSFKKILFSTLNLEIFDPDAFRNENILTADWIKEAFAKVLKHREDNRSLPTGPPPK